MSAQLIIGNRVRVTLQNRMHAYRAGDKGIVLWGPSLPDAAGDRYYLVVMDKDANGNAVVFNADEIEPDVQETTAPTSGVPPQLIPPEPTGAAGQYKQA
jgi:hypothetical protein